MKRHPALEPFSRDHNTGLILARALIEGRPDAEAQFREAWDRELADHFSEEERLLLPHCARQSRLLLLAQHLEIILLGRSLPETMRDLGEALEKHIRWEERELFPELEASMSEEALSELLLATDEVEKRRWAHEPNRERLVRRRWEER